MSGALIPLMGNKVDALAPLMQIQNILSAEAGRYKTEAETATEQQRPDLVRAQAGEVGARTGLLGAQTVGAQIQNELSKLMLGYRGQFAGAVNPPGGGGQESMDSAAAAAGMPWATGGGGGTGVDLVTPAARPGPNPLATGSVQPATTTGTTPPNALAAYATTAEPAEAADVPTPALDAALGRLRGTAPGGAGGQALPAAATGGSVESGGAGAGLSPNGVLFPGIPGPIPKLQAAAIPLSPDPLGAMHKAADERRLALNQLVSGATDTASWNTAVRRAWEMGYLTKADVGQLWNHFEYQDAMARHFSSPETQVGAATAAQGQGLQLGPSGAVVNPTALSTRPPVIIERLSPDGKTVVKETIPAPAYVAGVGAPGAVPPAAGGAGAQPPAATAAGPVGMPAQQWARMVNGSENPTGDPTRRNPRSSATGNGQFLDDTWLHIFKQEYPQVSAGLSDAAILAMRGDPDRSLEMTVALGRENAPLLAAKGIPVNASTLRLAHWFGPDGAANIFHGAQDAPISSLVSPKVLAANPDLAKQTVRSLVMPVVSRFGLGPVDLSRGNGGALLGGPTGVAPPAPAAAAPGGGNPITTPPALPEPLPGAIPGAVSLTPQAQAELDIEKQRQESLQSARATEQHGEAEAYGEQSKNIITAAAGAQQKFERLDVLQNAADQYFRPGQTAELRKAALTRLTDALQTIGVKPPDWMVKGATGGEVIDKEGGYLAAEMTKSLGSREAASVFSQIRNIQPNLTLSTGGFNAIIQSIRQGVQRDSDLGTFREQWVADPARNGSIRGMVDAFNKAHPVEAYASRIMPYPMPAKADQLKTNVIYSTAPGSAARQAGTSAVIWDGRRFQPIM